MLNNNWFQNYYPSNQHYHTSTEPLHPEQHSHEPVPQNNPTYESTDINQPGHDHNGYPYPLPIDTATIPAQMLPDMEKDTSMREKIIGYFFLSGLMLSVLVVFGSVALIYGAQDTTDEEHSDLPTKNSHSRFNGNHESRSSSQSTQQDSAINAHQHEAPDVKEKDYYYRDHQLVESHEDMSKPDYELLSENDAKKRFKHHDSLISKHKNISKNNIKPLKREPKNLKEMWCVYDRERATKRDPEKDFDMRSLPLNGLCTHFIFCCIGSNVAKRKITVFIRKPYRNPGSINYPLVDFKNTIFSQNLKRPKGFYAMYGGYNEKFDILSKPHDIYSVFINTLTKYTTQMSLNGLVVRLDQMLMEQATDAPNAIFLSTSLAEHMYKKKKKAYFVLPSEHVSDIPQDLHSDWFNIIIAPSDASNLDKSTLCQIENLSKESIKAKTAFLRKRALVGVTIGWQELRIKSFDYEIASKPRRLLKSIRKNNLEHSKTVAFDKTCALRNAKQLFSKERKCTVLYKSMSSNIYIGTGAKQFFSVSKYFKKFRGVVVFDLFNDDFKGTCAHKKFPLLESIRKSLQ